MFNFRFQENNSKILISQGTNYKFVSVYHFDFKRVRTDKDEVGSRLMMAMSQTTTSCVKLLSRERDLDFYCQLNQNCSNGKAPS